MLAPQRTMPTTPDQMGDGLQPRGHKDPERFFAEDRADLARRSARSGFALLGGQGTAFALTFVVTPIVARLLTPEEFGLVAMVTAVTAFIVAFRDLGLTQATVQRPGITHAQVSNLFWINVAVGLTLGALVAALAAPLARFYSEPALVPIALALAAGLPLASLGAQHQAVLERRLLHGRLAIIRVVSVAGAAAVTVAVAATTGSFWALVAGELTAILLVSVGCWVSIGWRPGPPRRHTPVGPMLRFGTFVALGSFVGTAQLNADKVIIGRVFGDATLGAYNRAFAILIVPVTQLSRPLTRVALPTLARLHDQPDRFRAFYRRGLGAVAIAGLPLVAAVFVAAEPIVMLLLGEQWTRPGQDAAEITRALAPSMLGGVLGVATTWPYLALARTKRQFVWLCFATALQVIGFLIAAQYSAVVVAATTSAIVVSLRVPAVVYCFAGTFMRFADFVGPVWRPLVAATTASTIVALGDGAIAATPTTIGGHATHLLALGSALAMLYLIFIGLLPGGRSTLRETIDLLRHARAE